jgi:hypothetical protein
MKKPTLLKLVEVVRDLEADLSSTESEDHGMHCFLIDAENAMHFGAIALLEIADEDAEVQYDPNEYLLRATTPEACNWVLDRIKSVA